MTNRSALITASLVAGLTILAVLDVRAQNRIKVRGIVYDGGTGAVASGVDVKSQGRVRRTDARGFFEIEPSKAAPIEISDIRFHSRQITYRDYRQEDTLRIHLTPNTNQIGNILVSNQIQSIYQPEFENVLDYALVHDTLVVLSYIKSKPSVEHRQTVYLQNTLTLFRYGEKIQRLTLPDYAQGLHVDPLERVYILGSDFILELRANRNEAYLLELEKDYFQTQVWPLTARRNKSVFFRVYPTVLPEVVHFVLLSDLDSIKPIRLIRNTDYFDGKDILYDDLHPLLKNEADALAAEYGRSGPEFAPMVSATKERSAYIAPQNPTFAEGDHILIYDHMNSWIFEHDLEGNPVDSVRMYYHQFSDEKLRNTLQDASTGYCYALHEKAGVFYLRFIDYKTGSVGRPFKLKYPYIKNARIYNGWVYYVYRDLSGQEPYSILREKIPDELTF